jgi:hypothetical protein
MTPAPWWVVCIIAAGMGALVAGLAVAAATRLP